MGTDSLETSLPMGQWFWQVRWDGDDPGVESVNPVWEVHTPQGRSDASTSAAWGHRLDFDGDGFDDLAACVLEPGGLSTLLAAYGNADRQLAFQPLQSGRCTCSDLYNVGDVNGDGYSDIAIGVYNCNPDDGHLLIYYGRADRTLAGPTWVMPPPGAGLGRPTGGAGDLNGDGYGDIAVQPVTSSASGFGIYTLSGSHGQVSTTWVQSIVQPYGSILEVLAPLGIGGDLDADGFADIAIGLPLLQQPVVRIYFGADQGVSSLPRFELASPDPQDPETGGDLFGNEVGLLGDIDGDGALEMGVGSRGQTSNEPIEHLDVYRGFAFAEVSRARLDLRLVQDVQPEGVRAFAAGDVNGDGFDDAVVAPCCLVVQEGSPLRLYWGTAAGLSEGSWIELSTGPGPVASYLWEAIRAGDIDRDGFDDVAFPETLASPDGSHVTVVWGGRDASALPRSLVAFTSPQNAVFRLAK